MQNVLKYRIPLGKLIMLVVTLGLLSWFVFDSWSAAAPGYAGSSAFGAARPVTKNGPIYSSDTAKQVLAASVATIARASTSEVVSVTATATSTSTPNSLPVISGPAETPAIPILLPEQSSAQELGTQQPIATSSPTSTQTLAHATGTATITATALVTRNIPATPTTSRSAQSAAVASPTHPPSNGTPILPTGAKYGDHNPNVPGRVVRIVVPSIKLDTKVYEVYAIKGVWEVAEYAAGHHYSTKNPGDGGNIVLSGHNNWKGEVFRYLENLKAGDEVDLWTQAGKKYVYKVRVIEKLKEVGVSYEQRLKNAHVMDDTPQEQLTLISCWPYTTYTHRLIVIADPVPAPAS